MAQPFECLLLVGQRDKGDLRDEVGGRVGGVLAHRAEGVDGWGAGAKDLVPDRAGNVTDFATGALR
eukprot:7981957-Lingulodinium_polyedra.AAC.1